MDTKVQFARALRVLSMRAHSLSNDAHDDEPIRFLRQIDSLRAAMSDIDELQEKYEAQIGIADNTSCIVVVVDDVDSSARNDDRFILKATC